MHICTASHLHLQSARHPSQMVVHHAAQRNPRHLHTSSQLSAPAALVSPQPRAPRSRWCTAPTAPSTRSTPTWSTPPLLVARAMSREPTWRCTAGCWSRRQWRPTTWSRWAAWLAAACAARPVTLCPWWRGAAAGGMHAGGPELQACAHVLHPLQSSAAPAVAPTPASVCCL
jgi:hypothetical protein